MGRNYLGTVVCALLSAILVGCGTPSPLPGRGQPTTGAEASAPTASPIAAHTPTTQPTQGSARSTEPGTVPGVAAATATPMGMCGAIVMARYDRFETLEQLAWSSHQIVAGTVIEHLPSVWVTSPNPERAPELRRIATDVVVQVETRLRGLPGDTIRVRQPGGSIDGCSMVSRTEPILAVGSRVLLFLNNPVADAPVPTFSVLAGPHGTWRLNPDGTVTTSASEQQRYNGRTLAELPGQVRAILTSAPPATDPIVRRHLVPLDRAPLPTTP